MPEDGLPIVKPTDNYYQAFINWEKNEYWDIYTNGILASVCCSAMRSDMWHVKLHMKVAKSGTGM